MSERRAIVVSGCNNAYFHYLQDLLRSFVACGAMQKYDFGVIDGGLDADQVAWLKDSGVHTVIRPQWPISGLEDQPEWYKVCLGRPFFPDFFPDWDVIVYLDSDSWLHSIAALDMAVEGAWQDGFAACPMVDRSLWPLAVQTNTVMSMKWHKNCLEQYFGPEIAQEFQLHPILSGSFFAGRRDAPHWAAWQGLMREGLKRKIHFELDQASMTLAIHQSKLPTHFLPMHLHWIAHLAAIGLDARTGIFVEPYLPHLPIASISLAAHSKTEPMMVRTTDGRLVARLLRYKVSAEKSEAYFITVLVGQDQQQHNVDGVATQRFRDAVLDAVDADSLWHCLWRDLNPAELRDRAAICVQFEIAQMTAQDIEVTMGQLRAAGYVCYAMDDGKELLAINEQFCRSQFGTA